MIIPHGLVWLHCIDTRTTKEGKYPLVVLPAFHNAAEARIQILDGTSREHDLVDGHFGPYQVYHHEPVVAPRQQPTTGWVYLYFTMHEAYIDIAGQWRLRKGDTPLPAGTKVFDKQFGGGAVIHVEGASR